MKVCIMTLGSRGDVQPYVALAKKLMEHGHEAVICTGGSFRSFIVSRGVSFVETSSDLMAVAQTEEGKAVLEHPLRNMGKAIKLTKDIINPAYYKLCLEYLTPLFESLPEYDRGIVGHYLGAFGYRKKPVEEIAKELCMTSDGVIKSYKAIVRKMREKYPDSMFHIWRRAHAAVQRATGR